MMQARNFLFILLFAISPWLSAKPLQFEEQYLTFEKQPVALQSLIGKKPIYLKFWATWCLDCRRELPSLEQAYLKYRDKIAVFAVNLNINETDAAIRLLQQKNKMTTPVLMDNNGTIAGNFEFKGTPFHVLINAKGDVVYTTYKDDAQLAEKLAQLAGNATTATTTSASITVEPITALPSGPAMVYFSATWCDWYMKDIRPEMSENCTNALQLVNELYRGKPQLPLTAYVTHLWTEQTDVLDYVKKFAIPYPVKMDHNNQQFRQLKANGYPTLIVFNDGKEIGRFTDFENAGKVQKDVEVLLEGK